MYRAMLHGENMISWLLSRLFMDSRQFHAVFSAQEGVISVGFVRVNLPQVVKY